MMAHPKIGRVRAYLEFEFPGLTIEEREHFKREAWLFQVGRDDPRERYRALVPRDFLDDNDIPEDQVEGTLRAWHLAEEMRKAGGDYVTVDTDGLKERIPPNEL
jgi:hypothetical protein